MALTETVANSEASTKDQITNLYLSWPQTVVTLQIRDPAAPVGLRHHKDALREHKILVITDTLPETPAAEGGLCCGDVVEKIGSHDAAEFISGGGKIGAAAEDDGTLSLTVRRPNVKAPVADASLSFAKADAEISEATAGKRGPIRQKKRLEADLAPTPLRSRNLAPPNVNYPEKESLASRRSEEPLCRRCGIHAVSKRTALQQKGLCCNKCPNHGPWCTMHERHTCGDDVAEKNPEMKSTVHERCARGRDAVRKRPEMEVECESRPEQEEETDKMELEEEEPVENPWRARLMVIEDPVEKRRKADEEKRLKAEEKRLKAEEEKCLQAEVKRLKANKDDEEKRLKVEEKRLKVEAAAALRKLDVERKQQDKRNREEEKAVLADLRKKFKAMAKSMAKGPAAEKAAAANPAAEGTLDAEKAATEEVAAEEATAELAAAKETFDVEKAATEEVAVDEATAEQAAAKDKEAMMAETSEAADMALA